MIESGFWVIPKIKSANLCKPIHGITNYSTSICLFESRKFGKEGKKSHKKNKFLENNKRFLDEIKNIFHSFSWATIWQKNKNLIKNTRHKVLNFLQALQLMVFGSILPRCCSKASVKAFSILVTKIAETGIKFIAKN